MPTDRGEELKWRPSRTEPSASVRKKNTQRRKKGDLRAGFTQLRGGGEAAIVGSGLSQCGRLTDGGVGGEFVGFKSVGDVCVLGFPFCRSAAHSCCLSAQSCGGHVKTRSGLVSEPRSDVKLVFLFVHLLLCVCNISVRVSWSPRGSSALESLEFKGGLKTLLRLFLH